MIKKLYWNFVTYDNQKIFFTVSNHGINFVASPKGQISEIYDLYPKCKFQFEYKKDRTNQYEEELEEYLNTERTNFNLSMDLSDAGDSFQHLVWQKIMQIPYGEVRTYHDLEMQLGINDRKRLVKAINANPLLIVIPDHRVIETKDQLGDYRGGLAMKSQLLEMEAINGINNI
ncbi:methylated-DNA--[protein]-cysteine S-methyltransferase [Philodulcilactobacillus myokoensis]|uniref:Methylated-DNA--[protein]-cysteine S-methyltransferase n=1 Tax=Philodulcilactobacillus myokoensis TaxID=2929573 RepID=A0A9W6B0U7_9LACO|nr:methylated-DNA--[protein]-cysteine S-methyltransferase [Philodulcilactobacillus myokoensis]GLB46455.1 methylated-DNA--[protein]-cysteine S-methyltransferase [Philodulcilactobacillus myokoensis]